MFPIFINYMGLLLTAVAVWKRSALWEELGPGWGWWPVEMTELEPGQPPSLAIYSSRMSILKALTSPFLNSQAAYSRNHTASCPRLLSSNICQLGVEGPGPTLSHYHPQFPALCAQCPEMKERNE